MPGSRVKEVRMNLPTILEAAANLVGLRVSASGRAHSGAHVPQEFDRSAIGHAGAYHARAPAFARRPLSPAYAQWRPQ